MKRLSRSLFVRELRDLEEEKKKNLYIVNVFPLCKDTYFAKSVKGEGISRWFVEVESHCKGFHGGCINGVQVVSMV